MPKSVRSVTSPEGANTLDTSKQTGRGWSVLRAGNEQPESSGARIAYVESYGSGSHARIARLLQEHSRHAVDVLLLDREHWRWLALTAHRAILDAITSGALSEPDALILSGPMDAGKLAGALPLPWRGVPRAVYFHESQWTYPGEGFDARPYLVGHLEAVELADRVWFNSRYHRDAFLAAALACPSNRVRALAKQIVEANWQRVRVVYPPVRLNNQPMERAEMTAGIDLRIVWAARWEREKRPDLFVEAILRCADVGLRPLVHVVGGSANDDALLHHLGPFLAEPAGYLPRAGYEATLAGAGAWVSTTEHEFFGVAAVEAAMAGAAPVVPDGFAYTETLPSAITYPAGDVAALVRRLSNLARRRFGRVRPWTIDARRFDAVDAASAFDARCDELISAGPSGDHGCSCRQPFAS